VGFSVALLALVLVNFGFDWWRRLDFEAERGLLEDEKKAILEHRGEAEMLLQTLRARLEEQDQLFAKIHTNVEDWSQRLTSQPSPTPQQFAEAPVTTPGESEKAQEKDLSFQTLLNTPVEVMEEKFKAKMSDAGFQKHLLKLHTTAPDKWNIPELIETLETEYGIELSSDEKWLLAMKAKSYGHAVTGTRSRFLATLGLSELERFERGEYERPLPSGEVFGPPESTPGEIFATSNVGPGVIFWRKTESPELHRLSMMPRYLTQALVEDLQAFFQERSKP